MNVAIDRARLSEVTHLGSGSHPENAFIVSATDLLDRMINVDVAS